MAAPKIQKYVQLTSIVSINDLFGSNAGRKSDIRDQATDILYPLVQALINTPGSKVVILGHVDSQKTVKETRALSSYFAWRTFSFFVKSQGIDRKRIAVKGLGNDVPLAREDTALGRARNRRVEIQIFFPDTSSQ